MADPNTPPTGELVIAGAAALQGVALTAVPMFEDADGLGPLSFAWQRDDGAGGWSVVVGATGATHVPGQADVGHALRAVVTYVDQLGTAELVASGATAPIGNVNDAPTGSLTVPGIARQGVALAVAGAIADADGVGPLTYRWQRDEGVAGWRDIAGAVASTYLPVQADVGHALRVVAGYTDLYGTVESVVGGATPAVANVNDAPTGSVAVAGVAVQGGVLGVVDTLEDADGMGDAAYVWQRSDLRGGWTTIPYASGPQYVPTQADVGRAVRAVASYVDGFGTGESVASAATAVVANANDAPAGEVAVAGVPQQGVALTAAASLSDADGLGVVSFGWQRFDGGVWGGIAGASGARYVPVQADVGHYLRAVANYVDGFGTAERVASDATDFVANVNDVATGSIVVSGSAVQNARLSASITLGDADGVPAWTPRWQRLDALAGWLDIGGATGTGYVLTQADVGHQVRVLVAFTDLLGSDENVASPATAEVANVNDRPTGEVVVAGVPVQGSVLSASNTLDDADGMTDPAYAWQRLEGGVWSTIAGAVAESYALAAADAGRAVRVVAQYVDDWGTAESVASAGTAPVVALADLPAGSAAALGLFDAAWYLAQNPDVAAAGANPFQHYMVSGWREGRDPSALFHTRFYLNQNPDVAAAGINPLVHFAESGWREGRDPSAAFSLSAYLAAYPDIGAAGVDPLLHYVQSGRGEGRVVQAAPPHGTGVQDALVDAAWYYARHPEVAVEGVDASASYHGAGWRAGWDPNPWFHTAYYLNQNPDIRAAGIDPLQHFEGIGWREGRDPSVLFSVAGYEAANPDVAAAGVDPLLHYVLNGRVEGRAAVGAAPHGTGAGDPLVDAEFYYARRPEAAAEGLDASADFHAVGWRAGVAADPWFDTAYYLAENPDVRAAGVDPLLHYEANGWREGRLPSLLFSPGAYLAANPDVAAAGVEPLLHFIASGRGEGRAAVLAGGVLAADPLVDAGFYDRQLGATLIPGGVAGQQQAAWSYDRSGWQRGLDPDAWFDTSYYLAHNPDVAAAHINPLLHYESSGWREGRDPSAGFSTTGYLAANPDVRAAGVDPLLHYVEHGQFEGRVVVQV